jgi:hypothetical protein
MSRSLRKVLPAVVLIGALAGCSGSSGGSASPKPSGTAAPPAVNTAAAAAECHQFSAVQAMITAGTAGDSTNAKVLATLKAHGTAWASLLKAAAQPAVKDRGEPGVIALGLETAANELGLVRTTGVIGTQAQVAAAWAKAQAELATIARDCASA